MQSKPYATLGIIVAIHLVIMFGLTYVGVNALNHIYPNLNRFYMAVLMVSPMVIVMLIGMAHMFENKRLNLALIFVSAGVFLLTFFAIRTQALVGNQQFLKSMIPHHSIAIKTCQQAQINDKEIEELCDEIIEAQREEINQMEDILKRME